ncbi:Alpha/Beta hydrolase protein [Lipomyces tetrasporus]|uniref:Alpha/Beta hydrolase protein n=1 Tax=Lipomyces tetrasporus TaxID=54092 RepID=A0AAD7VRI0_9ASCO|nr:Alpha/Beta hydrolase protein [Lipomyces tetrasporus]KAJ8098936.1 Alpha/Beta hydrolase protein [Lipomyces tetrasporus]
MSPPQVKIKHIELSSKIDVFYRESGPSGAPVILLLHGFPSSSHQYRNLIPILASKYRVIAPDLPGFGFTTIPSSLAFKYTFGNLASTIVDFVDALSLSKFAVFIFDYGAPTGLRLALERPEAVSAVVSQNGNAYVEGLGEFWEPIKQFWASDNTPADREKLGAAMLSYEATKWQYEEGTRDPSSIAPESYTLDYALLQRPGNADVQLDLFRDYESNLKLYPKFQEYLRTSNVPVLAVWGKNDPIFIPPGAEAYKRDSPKAEVHLLDAGHFAVETETTEIGQLMLDFFNKHGI